MAFLGSSEVGLRLLLSPMGGNVIVRTACVTVGVGFPVYSTFKAIEQKDTEEQERWLVYWTVYGCFSVAEVFTDKFVSWFPCYYHAKLAFLIWLQLPSSNGARHILLSYLRPLFLRYQGNLDRIVDGTRNDINNFIISHQVEIELFKNATRKLAIAAYQALGEFRRPPSSPEGSSSRPIGRITGSSHPDSTLGGSPIDDSEWIDVMPTENGREPGRPRY